MKLITIVATDGVPSDTNGQSPAAAVSAELRNRPSIDKSFVTFLSCTDNDSDVAYLKELDSTVPHVDEVGLARCFRQTAGIFSMFMLQRLPKKVGGGTPERVWPCRNAGIGPGGRLRH